MCHLKLLSGLARVQVQMQVGCGRQREGLGYLELMAIMSAAALPERKVLLSVCRRRLAQVHSRPDSGSQTSGRAG